MLDLACGTSITCVYPNTVGFDVDWSVIKELRKQGIRAIQRDMRFLQAGHISSRVGLDDNSADSVTCFYPPANDIFEDMPDPSNWEEFEIDRFYDDKQPLTIPRTLQQRMVQYSVGVAKKYFILHEAKAVGEITGSHGLNPEFLSVYGLRNLKEIDLEKCGKLLVMEKHS
ncbi:MAG: hypothetical protein Q8N99_02350 [Nanoarchaeota archaeon]|nr:hypothetical protein [Nanoarchaeota archaeon]